MEIEVQPASFIENEIQKFESTPEFTKASLIKLSEEFAPLTTEIIPQEDKNRLKEVYAARQILKRKRVAIKNIGKELREDAVRFQKAVIAKEDELIGLISPTELALESREDEYYAEKERLRIEDERRQSERIQNMLDQLNEVNYAIDFHELKALTDEQFQGVLAEAKVKHEESEKLKEIERQKEEERLRLEAEAKQKEEERLDNLRKEQEERERIFNEEQAKIKAENERIRQEQEAKEKELQVRQRELERQEQERINAAKVEQARKDAEEKSRVETEQRIKREIQEKAEREQREKEEATEKLLFGEDSDRFGFLAQQLEVNFMTSQVWTHMKSKRGKSISFEVREHLQQALDLCKKYKRDRKQPLPEETSTRPDNG